MLPLWQWFAAVNANLLGVQEVEELEAYLRKGELPPALREAAPEGGPQGPGPSIAGDGPGMPAKVEAS